MENNNNKPKKENEAVLRFFCIAFIAIFCAVIVLNVALFILKGDKDISESENRVLEKRPAITLSGLADGSFMKSFETWLSDQFPFRDRIISLKTSLDRACGKKEENGVYIGKDGFLFEKQSRYDDEKVGELTKALSEFTNKHKSINTVMLLSPNSSSILSEYLPDHVVQESQKEQLSKIRKQLSESKIKWIDCYGIFENRKDKTELFYRTDHHWTTTAAFEAFEAVMKQWKKSTSKVKFKFSTVSSEFCGTLSSSLAVESITDEISICAPENADHAYIVSYENGSIKKASLFEKEKLAEKNKYEVFLGGNYDKVVITTNAQTDDVLLVVKDSYANCMIPMLTPFFSKIVIVDPRYCSETISSVTDEYDFTHLLFLYNLNTFLEDTSLKDALI